MNKIIYYTRLHPLNGLLSQHLQHPKMYKNIQPSNCYKVLSGKRLMTNGNSNKNNYNETICHCVESVAVCCLFAYIAHCITYP